jgi:putative SOS response-associated peptidase YedK
MCYTIEINLTREQLEKRFNASLDKHLPYRKQQRASAFTLPDCPVITSENYSEIRLYKWGLIPFWSKDENYAREIRLKTFNAKAETITDKASFKHLIKSKKCLVLVNGFYEWQARGKEKQPYF